MPIDTVLIDTVLIDTVLIDTLAAMEDSFEELYDEATIRAVDDWRPPPSASPALRAPVGERAAGRVVAGALTASVLRGVADVFEPDDDGSIEIIERLPMIGGGPGERVTLFFVPNDPQSTIAVIRPND